MTRRIESHEQMSPDLFELEPSRVTLPPALMPQLTKLVGSLLAEIAAALASGEAGDE
jgi:hypothetical protein